MTVQISIKQAEDLIRWMDSKINDLEFCANDRNRIAAACFDLAHEHHRSIILLIANSLSGSAFSLVRLLFESYIRGLWLLKVATDQEIEDYKNENFRKSFSSLIDDVERLDGYNTGVLKRAKEAGWASMNSYTHGGFLHLVRRNTPDYIEPNYSDAEKIEVINFANSFSLLAALGIADIANNVDLAGELYERINNLNPKP